MKDIDFLNKLIKNDLIKVWQTSFDKDGNCEPKPDWVNAEDFSNSICLSCSNCIGFEFNEGYSYFNTLNCPHSRNDMLETGKILMGIKITCKSYLHIK